MPTASTPGFRSGAVFLSYAREDSDTVRQIARTLRGAGVEVWFDQSELVGGDAWDAKIRHQIKACTLFVPVISAGTQARREGYFRVEWKLAAQRTHAIADGTPFLLPVAIDGTGESEALVPAEFRDVQWTRLALRPTQGEADGEVGAELLPRIKALLGNLPEAEPPADPSSPASHSTVLETADAVCQTRLYHLPMMRPLHGTPELARLFAKLNSANEYKVAGETLARINHRDPTGRPDVRCRDSETG